MSDEEMAEHARTLELCMVALKMAETCIDGLERQVKDLEKSLEELRARGS